MRTAIILAGGLGTRLRQLVSDVPKPMASVNGRPFVAHLMDYWIEQGITRFILSVGYLKESIIHYFGNEYRGIKIEYSEEESPLGTGGGVLFAIKNIKSDDYFVLLNGDTFFEVDLQELILCAEKNNADICYSLFKATEPNRYGLINCDSFGRISELNSIKAKMGEPANGGVYILRKSALINQQLETDTKKTSFEDEVLPAALNAGRKFFGIEFSGSFIDIGVPSDYQRAAEVIGTK